jgi:IS30 family transposase
MARRSRLNYTTELKAEIWDKYQAGVSLRAIGRSIDRASASIYGQLAPSGGIRPRARTRSPRVLSLAEREEISLGLARHQSMRSIASQLGRSPSTISREINRHDSTGHYRAVEADKQAWDRARRPKQCKLAGNKNLQRKVAAKLRLMWSPQQISGWLKHCYPGQEGHHVSHETIYRSLFIQARGVFKKELQLTLRSKRTIRRAQKSSLKGAGLGSIPGAVSIRERPASVEDRAVPGHWEGDLIEGSNKTYIATLVERHSRYVMLVKLENKKTDTVIEALIKQSRKLPSELYKSLTWDRGSEMTAHQKFSLATDIKVYFCDPQSPWQRGSNENTNGLLRQYFPKRTDLSEHSQTTLNKVARQLNERPRKTLQYQTPAERFNECVAAIN